ncbi:unnamed protein product [Cylicocyclus nassatus]|uniref:Ground-like domain-containing protein n=1 Tax=Cylicocyclus nassatus TaxID=53992 RepID=A0AA36DI39_CYLNA|nr:unnamed protein product [Cylicocyclus nassatus]
MLRLATLSVLFVSATPFFFGTGATGGGCGCAPPPICPPAPLCPPPPPAPVCPPPTSCGASYAAPALPPPPPPLPVLPPSYTGPSYNPPTPELPQSPVYAPPQVPPAPPPPPQDVQPIVVPLVAYHQSPAAATGPAYQQPPPPPSGYQGPVASAQRDSAAPQELVSSLQHEAAAEAAAAGSKNEEVIEEQDQALEKSGVEITTETPTDVGDSTSTAATETAVQEIEEKVVDITNLKLTDDPLCNSEDLRKLMLENIDDNLNSSKRLIQLAAEAQFGGRFDVICANGDFSYVTNTELFCQETKGDISCYTYRQL